LIKAGRLRPLGVGGTKRSAVLPDVPTIAEAGLPGYAANNWWGIFAPAGTPKPIVEKLYKDIQLALQSPEMLKEFDIEGAAPVTMTSAEFADFVKAEIDKWAKVVKAGNIKAQ
jgi:tripartite-type tricarboxylate transporter receptor subunit TctC